ncbi:BLUF domain-containing protein [Ancylomarina sp. 16SWW S1-10-2]|uniref:BLUF domain-containing protein n=1 Tax=Ancylomarina sp. 16SWW S1-10-2 TaxID=2499681 RepID=UPI0012AE6173|nr:BLUF domain-containing protein [Ancylomarina sp. 16SWW S1-10-2]MRT94477.1 BLUF domain-containing protein [Ancylomarina sp. 16SWW S1-10-2]
MSNLIHIVYISISHRDLSEKELSDFLLDIRAKNKKLDITGLLLYNEGSFIQVIEGEKEAIQTLFKLVKNDKRHTNIIELLTEPIAERSFPDWSMGFKVINSKDLEKIPGFSGLMNEELDSKALPGIAKQVVKLLNSFRQYT